MSYTFRYRAPSKTYEVIAMCGALNTPGIKHWVEAERRVRELNIQTRQSSTQATPKPKIKIISTGFTRATKPRDLAGLRVIYSRPYLIPCMRGELMRFRASELGVGERALRNATNKLKRKFAKELV